MPSSEYPENAIWVNLLFRLITLVKILPRRSTVRSIFQRIEFLGDDTISLDFIGEINRAGNISAHFCPGHSRG